VSEEPGAFELAPGIRIGGGAPPVFLAGPCVIESREHCLAIAGRVKEIFDRLALPVVFKASFDKANRTSIDSFRGPGLEEGLRILAEVRETTGLPLLTDIHDASQAQAAAAVVDVIQIPAFLCRQTDLVVAAARTGRALNVKKGQFLAPADTAEIAKKCRQAGNERFSICERGSTFGYGNLVVDMRSFPMIREAAKAPVVFDVTHSLQLPGGLGNATGGLRQYAPTLARAAAAAGVDGFFMEVHDDPERALSDRTTQLPIGELEPLLRQIVAIDGARREAGER
jgi:2-dehydro-3-deoxyphosphooctonate aldolase (KDO 8-P synthase)